MGLVTSYSELFSQNGDIWGQAIFVGVLIVGSAGLIGFMLSSVVLFFKMLAR